MCPVQRWSLCWEPMKSMPPSGVFGVKMDDDALIEAEIAQQLDQINLDNDNFQYDEDEEDFQEEDVDIPLEDVVIIHVYYVVLIFLFPFFFGGIALRYNDKMIQKNF